MQAIKDDSPSDGLGIGDKVTIIRGLYAKNKGYITGVKCYDNGIWKVSIIDTSGGMVEEHFTSCNLKLGW